MISGLRILDLQGRFIIYPVCAIKPPCVSENEFEISAISWTEPANEEDSARFLLDQPDVTQSIAEGWVDVVERTRTREGQRVGDVLRAEVAPATAGDVHVCPGGVDGAGEIPA